MTGAQATSMAAIWPFVAVSLIFALKHFLADFVLQTSWIAHGKEARAGWLAPLATHAGVHAGMTLAITLSAAPRLWWLAAVDFAVHFVIDRGKTLVGRIGCWTNQDARYWWLLGFDQLLHQITNVLLAAVVAAA
jgi:hypothetical protein